jgi:hypothetical protein
VNADQGYHANALGKDVRDAENGPGEIMLKPKYGKCYEITLSDGTKAIYRFDGFGERVKLVWIDIETDEVEIGFDYMDIIEVQYP